MKKCALPAAWLIIAVLVTMIVLGVGVTGTAFAGSTWGDCPPGLDDNDKC